MASNTTLVRIGGASGFWGDASFATGQLLAQGDLHFIVYDYLAEITMGILARAREKDPQQGYATDFVTAAMARVPTVQRTRSSAASAPLSHLIERPPYGTDDQIATGRYARYLPVHVAE